MSQLAEGLLLIARSDRGGLPLQRRGGRRRRAVRSGRCAASTGAGAKRVTASPSGTVVRGDRIRLEQALVNLVDNALRYGGGSIELVRARQRAARHATTGRGSRRSSSTARSTASRAQTPRADGAVPASGWRSSGRSRRRTAAARTPRTGRPTSGWRSRASRARSSRGSGPRTSRGRRSRRSRR